MSQIYNISASLPFLDSLSAGILQRFSANSPDFPKITILLPNRRSCRSLRESFLAQNKGVPMLLPNIRAIGDEDEAELAISGHWDVIKDIPPAISEYKRKFLLAEMIFRENQNKISVEQSLYLASELAAFLDEVQRENCSLNNLEGLVPEDLSKHWQITLDFFKVLSEAWPKKLEELGVVDPVIRRNKLMQAQAEIWQKNPPPHPLFIAGTMGSVPSTLNLIKAAHRLDNANIILPGLDTYSDEKYWQNIDDSHPQFHLKRILEVVRVERDEVKDFYYQPVIPRLDRGIQKFDRLDPAIKSRDDGVYCLREKLIAEIMRPASIWGDTSSLRGVADDEAIQINKNKETGLLRYARNDEVVGCSITYVAAKTLQEESGVIALMMRQVAEEEKKTAALVTNNRELAARVSSKLKRWEIDIDDSAGVPFSKTPSVVFMRLIADCANSLFAPIPLISLLKHPFAAGGINTSEFRFLAREFEIAAMRGFRPESGIIGIIKLLEKSKAKPERKSALINFIRNIGEIFSEFLGLLGRNGKVSASEIIASHIKCAEKLAATKDSDGSARLWSKDDGRQVAEFLAEQREALGSGFMIQDPDIHYAGFFEELWEGKVFRVAYGKHPRLAILSPVEARLLHYDMMILGGMNEGSWPMELQNIWMSRGMREKFGLPSINRKTGLSAHDFASFMCADEVVITRAEKEGGKPTSPSPWLLRLNAVLEKYGNPQTIDSKIPWAEWLSEINEPEEIIKIAPPEPRPAFSARPDKLPVTQIEKLMRDPYSVYAKYILKLKPLDAIDEDPDAADFGNIIHEILHKFVAGFEHGAAHMENIIRIAGEEFREYSAQPAVEKIWWPRFLSIAEWFIESEVERRNELEKVITEKTAELIIPSTTNHQPSTFTITAKADRIEITKSGTVRVIDYKTGGIPDKKDVISGHSPQLSLEALMAAEGGFGVEKGREVSSLEYWKISPSKEKSQKENREFDLGKTPDLLQETRDGVENLINEFTKSDTAYLSCPDPKTAPKYNDYEHLARIKEWENR